jgi:hypothetical protein
MDLNIVGSFVGANLCGRRHVLVVHWATTRVRPYMKRLTQISWKMRGNAIPFP